MARNAGKRYLKRHLTDHRTQCYSARVSYKQDWEKVALEMQAALEELRLAKIQASEIIEKAENRAVALQRKMAALHVLIVSEDPAWETDAAKRKQLDNALRVIRATSRPSEQLRRIFARSTGPLTLKELRAELQRAGCDLSKQSNPSGTVGAICLRLVEQGIIRRTKKAGRNAWETNLTTL
jgi:hypothetical protein